MQLFKRKYKPAFVVNPLHSVKLRIDRLHQHEWIL
jgi:hypothetical protein